MKPPIHGSPSSTYLCASTHLHQLQLASVHISRGWVSVFPKHDAHLVSLGKAKRCPVSLEAPVML